MDGDDVHRQSLYREIDSRMGSGPLRPVFRIGGSVIRERTVEEEAREQTASKDATPSSSKADTDQVASTPPAAASYETSSDLERGQQRKDGDSA